MGRFGRFFENKGKERKDWKRKIKNRNSKEKERACAGRWVLTQAADKLSSIVDVDNKLSSIVADGVDRPPRPLSGVQRRGRRRALTKAADKLRSIVEAGVKRRVASGCGSAVRRHRKGPGGPRAHH